MTWACFRQLSLFQETQPCLMIWARSLKKAKFPETRPEQLKRPSSLKQAQIIKQALVQETQHFFMIWPPQASPESPHHPKQDVKALIQGPGRPCCCFKPFADMFIFVVHVMWVLFTIHVCCQCIVWVCSGSVANSSLVVSCVMCIHLDKLFISLQ